MYESGRTCMCSPLSSRPSSSEPREAPRGRMGGRTAVVCRSVDTVQLATYVAFSTLDIRLRTTYDITH